MTVSRRRLLVARHNRWVSLLVSATFHATVLIGLGYVKWGRQLGQPMGLWITAPPSKTYEALEWMEIQPGALEMPRNFVDQSFLDGHQLIIEDSFQTPMRLFADQDLRSSPSTRLFGAGLSGDVAELLVPIKGRASGTSVSGDYGTAFTTLRNALGSLLAESDLLLIWCFDESISMVDDHQAVAQQLSDLYGYLWAEARNSGRKVMSVVTSYGARFHRHLLRPTEDLSLVYRAIQRIPVDPTGRERMCEALLGCLRQYVPNDLAGTHVAVIVITDETGEWDDTLAYMEQVIEAARRSHVRLYFLAREAAFGMRQAYMLWQGTRLLVDRGPETAMARRWPCNAFGERADLVPSGFGPYAQCRLAEATGGLFLMLRGQEALLLDWQDHELDQERMSQLRPEWSSWQEQQQMVVAAPWRKRMVELVAEAERLVADRPAGLILWEFPWEAQARRAAFEDSLRQARRWLGFWHHARTELEKVAVLQQQELDLRWQADWDLMYAETCVFQLQVERYIELLEQARRNQVPFGQNSIPRIVRCDLVLGADSMAWQAASHRLDAVAQKWPGTPWGLVAQLHRQKGYNLRWADYSESVNH